MDKTAGMGNYGVSSGGDNLHRGWEDMRAHIQQLWDITSLIPRGLGFDPDSFATIGYSPISVSTVIRPSLSRGEGKQLEQKGKKNKKDLEREAWIHRGDWEEAPWLWSGVKEESGSTAAAGVCVLLLAVV